MNLPARAAHAKHIAVLFHETDRHVRLEKYIVDHLARYWRESGLQVSYLFGTDTFVPADLLFVHVNLSVVPVAYLDFAARYPLSVNGNVRDIRKSVISENLVRPGDRWDGPVIVKSDLNFGGQPERDVDQSWLHRNSTTWRRVQRVATKMTRRSPTFASWEDYRIYDRLEELPERWFHHPEAVVEKFLPETEDGLFHLRIYQFLGDRSSCVRLASANPLIKAEGSVRAEPVEPHRDIVDWRKRLAMDYGKLDYLERDGRAVLIDANKTTGASTRVADEDLAAKRRHQAEGIYSFFS